MMTLVQVTRTILIQVGGTLGPAGTRTKYGPVIHLAQTNSWTARSAPPMSAHAWTGLNEECDWAYNDSTWISWISALFLNGDAIVSPPSPAHDAQAFTQRPRPVRSHPLRAADLEVLGREPVDRQRVDCHAASNPRWM